MLRAGDTARLNDKRSSHHGEVVEILQVRQGDSFPYLARMISHDDEGTNDFWFTADEIVASDPEQQAASSQDFDQGFGIGGLGRHIEDPYIPTVAQMEREDARRASAKACKRCGQSEYSGAIFTTTHTLCDDCVG